MMNQFLQTMLDRGLTIDTVYDIGACKGKWSSSMKSGTLSSSEFFLFEANPNYDSILKNTGFRYFNTVLSNPGRTSVNFYNGTDTGDSYYKETTKWYDSKCSIELPCTTLDNIVQTYKIPKPDFIKIDTQGSELDILSGAIDTMRDVKLIYTECPIIQYNSGSPGIQEYLNFFKKINFIPVNIFEIHRLEDVLVQIDIMFVKADIKDQFLEKTNNIRPFIF
jgi:FkbM family methyltransferase